MSCDCTTAQRLPKCIDTLIIGDVTDGSKNYNVIFKTPDGRIDIYPGVDFVYTDLIGVEDIDVRTGTVYQIWLNDSASNNINLKTAFTPVGGTSVDCVDVVFEYCSDEHTTQYITL